MLIELLLGLGSLPRAQDAQSSSLGLQVDGEQLHLAKMMQPRELNEGTFARKILTCTLIHPPPPSHPRLKIPLSIIISPLICALEQLDKISYPHKISSPHLQ